MEYEDAFWPVGVAESQIIMIMIKFNISTKLRQPGLHIMSTLSSKISK